MRVLASSGFTLADVVHSRLSEVDFNQGEDAARARGEVYGEVRPAFALVHALPFIADGILVEAGAIAVRARP